MADPTLAELSLEAGIRVNREAMLSATTPESKRAAFRLLAELCARRTPEAQARVGE